MSGCVYGKDWGSWYDSKLKISHYRMKCDRCGIEHFVDANSFKEAVSIVNASHGAACQSGQNCIPVFRVVSVTSACMFNIRKLMNNAMPAIALAALLFLLVARFVADEISAPTLIIALNKVNELMPSFRFVLNSANYFSS